MEELKTPTRFPAISGEFTVGGIGIQQERPDRSWARLRTCLIDNPKDDDFQRRQEVWSYHQQNRGLVKSLMNSLPDVPHRVTKRTISLTKKSQEDMAEISSSRDEGGLRFPKVQRYAEQLERRNGLNKQPAFGNKDGHDVGITERVRQRLSYKFAKQNPQRKGFPESILQRNSRNKLFAASKNVSFSLNDLSGIGDSGDRPSSSSSSDSSVVSDGILGNYGSSSHHTLVDTPRSVLDILSGNHLSDARVLGMSETRHKQTIASIPEGEQDREWFQRVIGDKEVINMTGYENFARTRPICDNTTVPPPKRLPLNPLNTSRRTTEPKRGMGKMLSATAVTVDTSGNNGNSSLNTHVNNGVHNQKTANTVSNQSKDIRLQDSIRINPPILSPTTVHRPHPPSSSPPVSQPQSPQAASLTSSPRHPQNDQSQTNQPQLQSPSRPPPIGQTIAPKAFANSPGSNDSGRYFPVFPGDGSPVRKIGGPKNRQRIQTLAPLKPSSSGSSTS